MAFITLHSITTRRERNNIIKPGEACLGLSRLACLHPLRDFLKLLLGFARISVVSRDGLGDNIHGVNMTTSLVGVVEKRLIVFLGVMRMCVKLARAKSLNPLADDQRRSEGLCKMA